MSSIGGWQLPARAANEVRERLLRDVNSRRASASVVGGDDVDADHRVRPVELLRRLEARRGRPRAPAGAPPARSARRTRTAARARPRAARRRGSSRGSRSARRARARDRPDRLSGLRPGRGAPAARARPAGTCRRASASRRSATQRALVGAGRAAEAEVDAAGVERLERAELLGDHERRVVRQHDAARADADRRRAAGDVPDHDRRRGARDAGHVVVLGEPEAPVSPSARRAARGRACCAARRPACRPATIGARSRIETGSIVRPYPARRAERKSPSRVLDPQPANVLCGLAVRPVPARTRGVSMRA